MNPNDFIIRILVEAQSKIEPVMAAIASQAENVDKRIRKLDTSARNLDKRFEQLDGHTTKLRNTMRSWSSTLDSIDRKSKSFSATLTSVNRNMDKLDRNAGKAASALGSINKVIDGLERKLNKLDAKMTKMGAQTYSPKVKLEGNEKTERQIDQLLMKLGALERKKTKVRIDTEREALDREIAAIEKKLDKLGAEDRRIKYQIELDDEFDARLRETHRKADDQHQRSLNRQRERRQNFLLGVLDDVQKTLAKEEREHKASIDRKEAEDKAYDARRRRALQLSADMRERQEREQHVRARRRLSELLRDMREVTEKPLDLLAVLRTGKFNAEYDRLKAQLLELAGIDVSPEVRLNTTQFDAQRKLVEARLLELGAKKAEIRAVLDYDRSSFDRFGKVLQDIGDQLDDHFQVSFIRLINNALRFAIVFSGPLLSSLTAVAGALVSVASAAGQAAAGLAGLASAAAAQAIPVIGLLAAAFQRVGAVAKVAQLAEQERDRGAMQSMRIDNQRANALDALANAHQAVTDAMRGLLDAQDNLTKARLQGIRTIQDMVIAERAAALASQNSQRALAEAVATGRGGSIRALQIQRDRDALNFDRQRADTAAAVAGGVENLDNVRQARQAVDQAVNQLDRANQQVERARRQLDLANSSVGAAANNYTIALAKLSEGERQLLRSIERIKELFDDTDGPLRGLTDTIVVQIAYAVDKAAELLQDPKLLNALQPLADAIGQTIRELVNFLASDEVRNAFAFFSGEAAENVRVFGDILQSLVGIFVDVSRAASGIFADALRSVAELLSGIDRSLSSNSGQNKLANFFEQTKRPLNAVIDLFGALLGLFAALAGPGGAADAGTEGIERLTRAIRSATAWVTKNAEEVRKFFRDSIESTGEILKVIFEIGRALVETFDPNSVRAFAEFIRTAVIPALEGFITIMNDVVKVVLGIVDLIPSDVFKLLGGTAGTFFVITRLSGLLKGIAVLLRSDVFKNAFAPMLATLKEVIARIPILNRLLRNTAGATIIGPGAGGGRGPGGGPAGGAGGGTVVAGPGGGRTTTPKGGRFGNAMRSVGRGVGWFALLSGGLDFLQNRDPGSAIHAADPLNILNIFGLKSPSAKDGPLGRYSGGQGWKNLWADITGQKTEIDKTKDAIKDFSKVVEDLGDISRLPSKMINELARRAEQLQDQAERNGLKDAAKSLSEFARNARTAAQEAKVTEDAMRGLRREGVNLTTDVARTIGAGAVSDIEWGLRGLRQGIPSSMREFQRMLTEQVKLIQTTLVDESGKRMPGWYEAMAKTYELAIENIKRLRDEGKISAREANQTIVELERKYRSFSAKNPFDISRDFAKQIAEGRGERRKAIEDVISQIESMPARFRRTAAESVIGLTKGMESRGEVPKGTAKRLAYEIGQHFADMRDINIRRAQQMAEGIAKNINKIPGFVDRALNWIGNFLKTVIDKLDLNEFVDTASDAWDSVKRWTRKLPSIVISRAQGGAVFGPGTGTSDSIVARLSAGEHVWTAQEVRNAGGHEVMYALRRLFGGGGQGFGGRFALGGRVGPSSATAAQAGRSPYPGMAAIPGVGGNGTPAGIEYVASSIEQLVRQIIKRFKALVTDGFDPTGTKHVSQGHKVTGTAVDFVPGSGGSWDLIDSLAKWAVSKGYTVGYDGRFGTNAWANHGRGHHLHIDFAKAAGEKIGNTIESVSNSINTSVQNVVQRYRQLSPFKLRGPNSALKGSLQAIFDEAVNAANTTLRPAERQQQQDIASLSGSTALDSRTTSGDMTRRRFARMLLRRLNIPERGVAIDALVGWMRAEGGHWNNTAKFNPLNTTLDLPGNAGTMNSHGVRVYTSWEQGLEATAKTLSNGLYRNILAALASGSRSDIVQAVISSPWGTKHAFAAGGPVRGRGTGTSDEILARLSNGEHVWTAQEVRAAGGHEVVKAMRALVLAPRIGGDTDIAGATNAIDVFLRGLTKFAAQAKKGGAAFASAIDVLFNDQNGAFAAIRGAIQRFAEAAGRVVQDMQVRVTRSGIFRVGGAAADPAIQGQIDIANLREQRRMLQTARAGTTQSIRRLREQLRNTTNEDDREVIRARIQTLRNERRQFTTELADNALELLARQEQMQEEIARQSADFFTRLGNQIDRTRRLNTARGNDQANIDLFDRSAAQMEAQLTQLRFQFDVAQKTGNRDLANELNDEIEEMETRLAELPIERVQAMVDLIDKNFTRRNQGIDRRFRVGEILGIAGTAQAKIDAQIASTLDEITALNLALESARNAGANDQVAEIEGRIEDLNNSIVDLTAQRLQAAIDDVNRAASFRLGLNDVAQRLAQLGVTGGMAATGAYNIAALGRTDFAGLGAALQQRGDILRQQLAGLQGLLGQAYATGNQNAIESLTTQIANLQADLVENTKAIRDNTDAAFAYRVEQLQQLSDFKLALNTSATAINDALGALTGTPDTATETRLLRERQQELQERQRSDKSLLQELIGAGRAGNLLSLSGNALAAFITQNAPGWLDRDVFDDAQLEMIRRLSQAILDNEKALIDNTKALQDVSASVMQTFSTSAWRTFRSFVFNGMGGLAGNYNNPTMFANAAVSGMSTMTPFGPRTNTAGGDHIEHYHINITHPTEVLDPTYIGQQIAFSKAGVGRI